MKARTRRDERGAILVITALLITALFVMVAIVIDLGATRSDRRGGQLAVDNAAAASGRALADDTAVAACETALDYLELTLESGTLAGGDCNTFASACVDTSSRFDTWASGSGDFVVTLEHPVIQTSPLMDKPSTIGAESFTYDANSDGLGCERFGVQVTTTGDAYFGGAAGNTARTSTVHAVARIKDESEFRRLNLLVLDRTSCQAFTLTGLGTVEVASVVDLQAPPNRLPGIVGLDSDGTGSNCTGQKATLEASGDATLRANGPCDADQTAECQGKGAIQVVAPFAGDGSCTAGADLRACSESNNATIEPDVHRISAPFTRAPVDHRFNCKVNYSSESWADPSGLNQSIAGCNGANAHTAYIDELKAFAGALDPAVLAADDVIGNADGWLVIPDKDPRCNSNAAQIFPEGNVYIDCGDFQVKATNTFLGGNVVFAGKVTVTGSGQLLLNTCALANTCSKALSWTKKGDAFNENQYSNGAAWAYAKDLVKFNAGAVRLQETVLYIPSHAGKSALETTGGAVTWTAPSDGPFSNLALWSAHTGTHSFAGNGALNLQGVYFVGESTLDYAGQADQDLLEAQFIANKMSFSGKGRVRMAPDPGGVEFPLDPSVRLVR